MQILKRTTLLNEIKIVPPRMWGLATIAFLAIQYLFNFVLPQDADAPGFGVRIVLGLAAGLLIGCYLLFLGYIYRDSKRRGMHPILWILVAILVPHALGLILYFILRRPLGGPVDTAKAAPFNYCPNCGIALPGSVTGTLGSAV